MVLQNLPFWNYKRCHYYQIWMTSSSNQKNQMVKSSPFSASGGLLKIIANKHDYNLTGFVLFQKTIMCSSRHNLIHCFVHIFFHWSFLMRCCERNQCPIWAACRSILPKGTRVGFKSLRSNLHSFQIAIQFCANLTNLSWCIETKI